MAVDTQASDWITSGVHTLDYSIKVDNQGMHSVDNWRRKLK